MDHEAFFDELTKIAAVTPYLAGSALGALGGAGAGALANPEDRLRGALVGGGLGAAAGAGGTALARHALTPGLTRRLVDKPLETLGTQSRYWRPGASDAGLGQLARRESLINLATKGGVPLAAGAALGGGGALAAG